MPAVVCVRAHARASDQKFALHRSACQASPRVVLPASYVDVVTSIGNGPHGFFFRLREDESGYRSSMMTPTAGALRLGRAQGGERFFLVGRPISGGDVVQICASGGWLTGRFECDAGSGATPMFYFSVELEGGGVEQLRFPIPENALLRWP